MSTTRIELSNIDRRLADTGNDLPGLGTFTPLSLAAAQKALRSDEALVTFLLPGLKENALKRTAKSSNSVIVVTKDAIHHRLLPEPSRRKIVERAGRLRCAMAVGCTDELAEALENTEVATRGNLLSDDAGQSTAGGLPESTVNSQSRMLYEDLLGPADDLIKGYKHLIIAPPADLLGLPFAALATGDQDENGNVPWLVRRQALSVLPSVGALASLRDGDGQNSDDAGRLLGVGDPLIGGRRDSNAPCNIEVAALRSAASDSGGPVISDGRIDQATGFALADPKAIAALPALADAECELRALATAFSSRGAETEILLRGEALEGTVKALSRSGELSTFDTLIFATHGLMRGEAGASEPALVLTPPTLASGGDDGLLTAGEVALLRLDADLVVLSACNTAAGADTNADGMSGLARAFFHAGARALMVTHWSVYSSAATEMSSRMFANRADRPGLRHAEALRLAMIDVMDDPRGGLRKTPAYWAAFAIVGL